MRDRDDAMREILGYARRIAVVGLSPEPSRPSNRVARTLLHHGYEVVPVNPQAGGEVLGLSSYGSLEEIDGEIDIVDVFRRSEHLADVARSAAAVGARSLWLQSGLMSSEARQIAESSGMDYVENRCLAVETDRLSEEMTLPPPA